MFYAGVAVLSAIASCYLLFRRGNAFNPDINPPVRLRRWTAALFAVMALCHVWYMPIAYFTEPDAIRRTYFIGSMLDSITILPMSIAVLLCMLQDRRRPLWPIWVLMMPITALLGWCVYSGSDDSLPLVFTYLIVLAIVIVIYMVRALRQYGRWLRDNYADLEHKEVWQTFLVLAAFVVMFGIYCSNVKSMAYEYAIQICSTIVPLYLLWRVETLSDLKAPPSALKAPLSAPEGEAPPSSPEGDTIVSSLNGKTIVAPSGAEGGALGAEGGASPEEIGTLLQQHCIDTQLYLQHDLTVYQLAKAIGTNRYYLSKYFSSQGTTYNAYINGLRICHFVNLYREASASNRPFTTKQLAHDSGYHSYSTFSLAFKQRMGKNVTTWINEDEEQTL